MFTLSKFAYIACTEENRRRIDTMPNYPKFQLSPCCHRLMEVAGGENGNRRRDRTATWLCDTAARNGHLDCLMAAHKYGFAWGLRTCQYAAAGGHMECVDYAQANGCPWDGSVDISDLLVRMGYIPTTEIQ